MRTFITLLLSLLSVCAFPQRSEQKLWFIYIDHEVSTDVEGLVGKLKEARDWAFRMEESGMLLIYLSTGLERDSFALMSFTNIDDGSEYQTESAYDNICAALRRNNRHIVRPEKDVDNIVSLFNREPFIDFFDSEGKLTLKNLTMDFYVGTDFWTDNKFNEDIIANLYMVLNLYAQDASKLDIHIYSPEESPIDYDKKQPFGARNLQGINSNMKIRNSTYNKKK